VLIAGLADDARARARCGGKARVRGIDVSKWQGAVDWRRVARSGVRFAFIRVSDGTDNVDPNFAANWRGARRARITRGAYQFFRPDQDPIAQADLLIKKMGPLRRGDLPPVLDLETSGGLTPRQVVARVRRWVRRVKLATGVDPIIYSNARSWIEVTGDSRRWRRSPLWVAHYEVRCPAMPRAWRRWAFHQHTDRGEVAGIDGPVDLNHFNGTRSRLSRLTIRSDRTARLHHQSWRTTRDNERRTAAR
jgi:lysozyme